MAHIQPQVVLDSNHFITLTPSQYNPMIRPQPHMRCS